MVMCLLKKEVNMKFAIGSDFHLDINEGYPFELKSDKDAFYLCCGDIAGEPYFRDNWLKEQIKRGYHGAFVLGNHQVYHTDAIAMQDMHAQLREQFNDYNNGFKFMENDSIYFPDENILLIGCTLWTDFDADGNSIWSGMVAQSRMNDYRWRCIRISDRISTMRWQDTVAFHKESMQYIQQTMDEYKQTYPDVKVILMTHHAPSRKSIAAQFMNSLLNSAFVSNLENFILNNPEIKLWVHGHVHDSCDYMVGDCRIVCNPRGYCDYGEGNGFNENLIIEI